MNDRFLMLVFIVGILLTLVFFSVSDRKIDVNYVFDDTIKIDSTNQKDTIIGFILLDSKKFFPERLELSNLKACIFNPNSKFTYEVYYSKTNKDYVNSENYLRTQNIVDVAALKITKMPIKITLEYPLIKDNLERRLYYSQIPKTNTLYIYDENNTEINGDFREFCDNVKKEDAKYLVKVIN